MHHDQLSAKWVREAVSTIDAAVARWNATFPMAKTPMRVAWGFATAEEAGEVRRTPRDYQHQEGLLEWRNGNVELRIYNHGDPEQPNYCVISAEFPEPQVLPTEPQRLFNVTERCEGATKLSVFPDEEGERLLITGVETTLAGDGLTGRVFHMALDDLFLSRKVITAYLNGEADYDHWAQVCGEEGPE